MIGPELHTQRLLLRRWREQDLPAFAEINADPVAMEYLGGPFSAERSDTLVEWVEERFEEQGFGFWAVELVGGVPFIGLTGLNVPRFEAPFMPAVEVGWRLSPRYWGHGYATEAATAALEFAFDHLELDEVVAFTAEGNFRSQAVMQRLGMHHDPADDFDHPLVAEDSPHRRHVVYRITRSEFQARSEVTERVDDRPKGA